MEPTIDLLARAPHMNSWFIDLDVPQIVDLFLQNTTIYLLLPNLIFAQRKEIFLPCCFYCFALKIKSKRLRKKFDIDIGIWSVNKIL